MPSDYVSLFLCAGCAPDGLRVEEFPTHPHARQCFVCGAPAERWFTRWDRVLIELLKERAKARAAGVVQEAPRMAKCDTCNRVAPNRQAGQRCFVQLACGNFCSGQLLTII